MSNITHYSDHVGANPSKVFKSTLFRSERLMLGLNCLHPGQEQHLHVHGGQDKFYFVVEGIAFVRHLARGLRERRSGAQRECGHHHPSTHRGDFSLNHGNGAIPISSTSRPSPVLVTPWLTSAGAQITIPSPAVWRSSPTTNSPFPSTTK